MCWLLVGQLSVIQVLLLRMRAKRSRDAGDWMVDGVAAVQRELESSKVAQQGVEASNGSWDTNHKVGRKARGGQKRSASIGRDPCSMLDQHWRASVDLSPNGTWVLVGADSTLRSECTWNDA